MNTFKQFKTKSAFTLIEILVVLAGILFPVFSQAKRSAKIAVSISNLKQCYLALSIYAEDNDGWSNMPADIIKAGALKDAPTCDPLDFWRKNCKDVFGIPLVGSYAWIGYVVSDIPKQFQYVVDGRASNVPLFADIFVSSYSMAPVHDINTIDHTHIYPKHPDKVLFEYLDGHCRILHGRIWPSKWGNGFFEFGWLPIFLNYTDEKP